MKKERFKDPLGRNRVITLIKGESMTHQSFKNECDVNNILKKYERTGLISHVNQFQGSYSDFIAPVDYRAALDEVRAAEEMFMALPSKVRARFDNSAVSFLEFVENPNNRNEMISLGLMNRKAVDVEGGAKSEQSGDLGGV